MVCLGYAMEIHIHLHYGHFAHKQKLIVYVVSNYSHINTVQLIFLFFDKPSKN